MRKAVADGAFNALNITTQAIPEDRWQSRRRCQKFRTGTKQRNINSATKEIVSF